MFTRLLVTGSRAAAPRAQPTLTTSAVPPSSSSGPTSSSTPPSSTTRPPSKTSRLQRDLDDLLTEELDLLDHVKPNATKLKTSSRHEHEAEHEVEEEFDEDENDVDDEFDEEVDEEEEGSEGTDMFTPPPTEFDDILNIHNPPKLTMEHYRLLKKIQFENGHTTAPNPQSEATEIQFVRTPSNTHQLDGTIEDIRGQLPPEFLVDKQQSNPFAGGWGEKRVNRCRFCKKDKTPQKVNQLVYTVKRKKENEQIEQCCLYMGIARWHAFCCVATNVNLLLEFVNERGMITGRKTNQNCAKHQRKLARLIKRARSIGLMSYTSNWRVPDEFLYASGLAQPLPHQIIPAQHQAHSYNQQQEQQHQQAHQQQPATPADATEKQSQ